MFIKQTSSGYKGTEQYCNGEFLIVVQDPFSNALRPELRAVVVFAKMRQLGHFMMASVNLAGASLTLSGTYGSDGLPFSIRRHFTGIVNEKATYADFTDDQKRALWDQLTPIPQDLQDQFWAGGGHNTCGSEGPAFHKWGKANRKTLKKHLKPVI
jgi:hypothetical protein